MIHFENRILVVDKSKAINPWQRILFANTAQMYNFLADTKQYVPIKLMSTTGNPSDFTVRGTLQKKNQANITKCLIWDTMDIS